MKFYFIICNDKVDVTDKMSDDEYAGDMDDGDFAGDDIDGDDIEDAEGEEGAGGLYGWYCVQ